MGTILISEPDDILRSHFSATLEAYGHAVIAVASGPEALAAIETGRVDFLLANVVLPGIDGIELVKRAEAVGWLGPVMFMAGFSAVRLKRGAGDPRTRTLQKPIHLRDAPAAIDRILDERNVAV